MVKLSNKVIVLEGLPASGKTILADYLRDNYGFLKINESLGKLGFNNTTNQKIIFQETLKKYDRAKKCKEFAIIDRGYPSMLAWDYCAEELGYAKDLNEKTIWVRQALNQNKLFEPYLYIYLLIKPQQSLKRRPRKETKIDVWSGKIGMQYCFSYYEDFFQNFSDKNFLSVKSDIPVKKIAKIIMNKIGIDFN
ncbi:MAG: hypothetical protein Athens101410_624 [Parcubacteria group bacterium Athens1014_10]|nr:MAG: hypothetical protein Athens101410_624 [Parcubacteria group bacterium Athens1014_10]TSD04810.1 MAG: hypothetical protein Athens071412_594 [Parcubacteria group bacterium Athens0714_12]